MKEFKKFYFHKSAVTEVILELLERLVESKKKEKKFELMLFWWGFTTLFSVLLTGSYFYWTKILSGSSYSSALSGLVGDIYLLILIGLIAICLMQQKQIKKKYDKAEKEFETLRKEMIDRSSELWMNDELWENRFQVYDIMEKNYDINLYHK